MVSGILLILSIIDFALAAPLLVKESQASVDAVILNTPKDVVTVLGKRVNEEDLAKLLGDYFKIKTWERLLQEETHAASSSAPLGPEHGSTSAVHAPEPNPAPSTANPNPLMEPSGPASKGKALELMHPPASSGYQPGHGLSGAGAPEVNPNPMPSTGRVDWSKLLNMDMSYPPPPRPVKPVPLKVVGQANEYQDAHGLVAQPLSAAGPMHPGPSADPLPLSSKPTDEPSAFKTWTSMSSGDQLPKLEPPKGVGQAPEPQQPNAGPGPSDPEPSTKLDSSTGLGVNRPLPPPTDSERATMGYRPPPQPAGPDLPSSPPTGADNPGTAVHTPSPDTRLSTIPEDEVWLPPPPPKVPEDGL